MCHPIADRDSKRRWRAIEPLVAGVFVAPGHPLLLSWIIMELYPDLDAAMAPDSIGYPVALSDRRIKGSIGAVQKALDVLSSAKSPLKMLSYAETLWNEEQPDMNTATDGTLKVMDIIPFFIHKVRRWPLTND